ncbi:hypothetical protein SARC_00347 [Sphaeroforma arctica JP610]|uniref:Nucleotide exchange factor Fes1 domain-containing protein n=1 Tax=Sphaeroforma arctica JP610 TaxID=667725 RepID=A0A0L0GGQ7_9EUKA|nr:hypothetical protein SARC_00347 [Sphaeroforma arctica JP610]KNC87523.1 hypothetical protein SARC_00347 [Sphaeroforma arctica JP610]|eukprot:XP_014161425.1 hypothetical protein SARC_00347 [Sphaeroforma arctica JP610]
MQHTLNTIGTNFSGAFGDMSLTKDEVAAKEEALKDLSQLVDSIDNALALISMGGYPYVIALVKSSYPSLVQRALDVLAITTQNNPDCQNYCLQEKVMEIVLPLLNAQENRTVQTKALYFMSSLIRHHEVATAEFIKSDGISSLVNVISEQRSLNDVRLATKAVFLLNIVMETAEIPQEIISTTAKDTALVPSLIAIAGVQGEASNAQLRELVLCVLTRLRNAGADSEQVLYDPKLNLKQVLENIQSEISALDADDRDAQLESLEYIEALLR